MNTETKTIELGGKTYEIRLVEPQPQPETKPTLPTLQEVFNKVRPKWCIDEANEIICTDYKEDDDAYHSQLSTERQCKRIQALIALQNIADYYNEEVDYRGVGYVLVKQADQYVVHYRAFDEISSKFKFLAHAENAIEILRNANLLENL
jgi:hypothetical protein